MQLSTLGRLLIFLRLEGGHDISRAAWCALYEQETGEHVSTGGWSNWCAGRSSYPEQVYRVVAAHTGEDLVYSFLAREWDVVDDEEPAADALRRSLKETGEAIAAIAGVQLDTAGRGELEHAYREATEAIESLQEAATELLSRLRVVRA